MKKFSIIVTTYNSEKFIGETIKNLLEIDYPYFSIEIYDDGSSDKTIEIIKSYSSDKIMIHNMQHMGTANIRNYAIKSVKCDYVLFVDSDDIVDIKILEVVSDYLLQNNYPDFLIFQWRKFKKYKNDMDQISYGGYDLFSMDTTIWNKVYSRELLNQLSFPVDTYFEDIGFSVQAALRVENRIFIPQVLYYYRQHSDSLTKKKTNAMRRLDIIAGFRLMVADLEVYNIGITDLKDIYKLVDVRLFGHLRAAIINNEDDIDSMAKGFNEYIKEIDLFKNTPNKKAKKIYHWLLLKLCMAGQIKLAKRLLI